MLGCENPAPTVDTRTMRTLGRGMWGAVAAAVLGAVVAPVAWADPAPGSGPTVGGTVVSGAVPSGLVFTDIFGSSGLYHGLGSDGIVYVWGSSNAGQLGSGAAVSLTPTPVDMSALPAGVRFTAVAGDTTSGYGLGTDGAIYAWGDNDAYQLGNGSQDTGLRPAAVDMSALPVGVTFQAMAVSAHTAYGLGSDGIAYAWGTGGALGQAGVTESAVPIPVDMSALPVGVTFRTLAAGGDVGYGLGSDGVVYAWGDNSQGKLGIGDSGIYDVPAPIPVDMSLLPVGVTFEAVIANEHLSSAYGLGTDGVVYSWGTNHMYQLGNGSTVTGWQPSAAATGALPVGVTFQTVATAGYASYGLGTDGVVYAWGMNVYGLLGVGDDDVLDSPVPIPVDMSALPGGVTFQALAAGRNQVFGWTSDGALYTWGYEIPDLVTGDTATYNAPVRWDRDPTVVTVTFGGVPGTDLSQTGRTWTATAPGGCGPVDVVVSYRDLFDATATVRTATHADGFAYGSAPAITAQPVSAQVVAGGTFTATVAVTGEDTPAVQWQRSADGTTWTDVVGQAGTDLTVTGVTTTTSYRAVVTSCWSAADSAYTVVSDPAVVSLSQTDGPGSGGGSPDSGTNLGATTDASGGSGLGDPSARDPHAAATLPATGPAGVTAALFTAVLLLVAGTGLLAATRRRRQRRL